MLGGPRDLLLIARGPGKRYFIVEIVNSVAKFRHNIIVSMIELRIAFCTNDIVSTIDLKDDNASVNVLL